MSDLTAMPAEALMCKLGEYICKLYYASLDDPFSRKVEGKPEELRKNIAQATVIAQSFISKNPTFEAVRKRMGLELGQTPTPQTTQMLCLACHGTYIGTSTDGVDDVTSKAAYVFHEDAVQGKLVAKKVMAQLLARQVLVINDHHLTLCQPLHAVMSKGNPLLGNIVTDETVRNYITSKRKSAVAPQGDAMTEHIKNIPVMKPSEMAATIGNAGYIGQTAAVRAICVQAYRHVQRLRRIHLEGVKPSELPKRENILCMGSTGVGKTYLLTILFEQVLKLPTAIVDSTRLSETGYVGDSVETCLTRLLHAANGNIALAQAGLLAFDEMDKLAGNAGSNAIFGGAGTNKDVSGLGVQRGLLKLLEGSVCEAPTDVSDFSNRQRVRFDTANVLFVGVGAFSGLSYLRAQQKTLGFNPPPAKQAHTDTARLLHRYGFLKEICSRFGQFIEFDDLSRDQLKAILERHSLAQHRRELELEGIGLTVEPAVIELLVNQCAERATGARGISSCLSTTLTDACYAAYSAKDCHGISLFVDGGNIAWRLA